MTSTHSHESSRTRIPFLSFDAAARGVAFHNVEDKPGNEEERRGLFTSSCAALAALAEKMGNRRDAEGQTGHDEV